jgi:peroxiredoxin
MVLLDSSKIEMETVMPDFNLKDSDGVNHHLEHEMGVNGVLIIFTCNHCPYAIAVWDRLISLASKVKPLGVNTVAINPNINPKYPDDSAEKMKEKCVELGITFPYLVDEYQSVAKAYNAQCTPDIYVLNNKKELVYHGRLDDNWQNESAVQKQDLKDALLALINNKEINQNQLPSMGCSIKWV